MYVIGRGPASQIVIPDVEVSNRHAQVGVEANRCWIADLGSTNGTTVNGTRITGSVWLQPNDVIQLGPSVTLVFRSSGPLPPGQATAPAQPAKKKRGCTRNCVMLLVVGLLVLVCGLLVLGGGGYYLYNSGSITQRQIRNAVGLGTGEINFVNLAGDTLNAELIRLDTESGSPETERGLSLEPLDIGGMGGVSPGSYQLVLDTPSGEPAGGICRLQIRGGDVYQLVAVRQGVAITLEGNDASSADDLDLLTSPLCRP
jgi:hypothetical protein